MSHIKSRVASMLLFISIVCMAFYIGGFNFDERGEAALYCFAFSILFGFVGFIFPFQEKA